MNDYDHSFDPKIDFVADPDFFDDDGAFEDESEAFDDPYFVLSEGDVETELWMDEEFETEFEDEGYSEEDYGGLSSSDTVGTYLKEMARVLLLTTEEEIDLAMNWKSGRTPLCKLRSNPTHKRAHELQQLVQEGIAAREHLIKANTRLVVSIAKKYMARAGCPSSI
ncbi:MAG: sigma-70 factor domain-containing protein [Anaerolineae bacterium]